MNEFLRVVSARIYAAVQAIENGDSDLALGHLKPLVRLLPSPGSTNVAATKGITHHKPIKRP